MTSWDVTVMNPGCGGRSYPLVSYPSLEDVPAYYRAGSIYKVEEHSDVFQWTPDVHDHTDDTLVVEAAADAINERLGE